MISSYIAAVIHRVAPDVALSTVLLTSSSLSLLFFQSETRAYPWESDLGKTLTALQDLKQI